MEVKYDDLIYYRKDLCEAYSRKRKNVTEEDADDLLRCLFEYLEQDIKNSNNYAYTIPVFGTMYHREVREGEETDRFLDACYNPYHSAGKFCKKPILERFDSADKKEIQRNQNETNTE